jgi:hypothetical protein
MIPSLRILWHSVTYVVMLQIYVSLKTHFPLVSGYLEKLQLELNANQYDSVLCSKFSQESLVPFMLPYQYAGSSSHIKWHKILQVYLIVPTQANRLSHIKNRTNQKFYSRINDVHLT